MPSRKLNVLFLCTGNSARSIMAEALLNATAGDRLRAYSAGSRPAGAVNPLALELIAQRGLRTAGLRSKDMSEFAGAGAPTMDFVITLCNQAAGEACPLWSGKPVRAHWAIDDPAAAGGSDAERRRAFAGAFDEIQDRLLIFASLPLDKLDRRILERRLGEIGDRELARRGPTDLADRIRAASRPLRRSLRSDARESGR